MNNMNTIRCFDQVKLLTTNNVKYLSAPPGTKPSPLGVWSVSAIVGADLLLVQNNVVIRIPPADVLKIADHQAIKTTIINKLGKLSDG